MAKKIITAIQVMALISGSAAAMASTKALQQAAESQMQIQQHETVVKQAAVQQALGRQLNQAEAELLVTAIKTSRFELVQKLIEMGVDIDAPSIGDGTALMMAVNIGDLDMVNNLLRIGANPNAMSEGDGNPLIISAKLNRLEIASVLLANGALIDAVVAGDETALITACRFGNFDMIKLLIERGADVNLAVQSDNGELRSPLNQALSEEVKSYLLKSGAKT